MQLVKMRSYWIRADPNPMARALVRKNRDKDTQGKRHVKTKADWSVAAASQRIPRIAGNHQKLGETHNTDSPSESSRRNQPCQGLIWCSNL